MRRINSEEEAQATATGGDAHDYEVWYGEAIGAANEAGYGPCSAADAIRGLAGEVADLHKQVEYWQRGTNVIMKCFDEAAKADPMDAPIPLIGIEAKRWHAYRAEAFRHALEMMGVPESVESWGVTWGVAA